jgi:hypothetical protein
LLTSPCDKAKPSSEAMKCGINLRSYGFCRPRVLVKLYAVKGVQRVWAERTKAGHEPRRTLDCTFRQQLARNSAQYAMWRTQYHPNAMLAATESLTTLTFWGIAATAALIESRRSCRTSTPFSETQPPPDAASYVLIINLRIVDLPHPAQPRMLQRRHSETLASAKALPLFYRE